MDESRVFNCESYASNRPRPRDRLSELPNSLTLEILSLLEMMDVVRTTILSKRWKDLWITVPCLDFGYANRSFIDGALAKWKGTKILKFSLAFMGGTPPTSDTIDSWLRVPIQKQVEELYLDFRFYCRTQFRAPQPLYSCSSITKLFLCNLKIEENVQLNQLKSLTIEGENGEQAMNQILSGAPVLEELVLDLFEICGELKIRSTSLKMLKIGQSYCRFEGVVNSMLRIEAPNLMTLEITPLFYHGDCLLDVPSLTNAILHFHDTNNEMEFSSLEIYNDVFRSICHVEKVTLSAWCMEYLVYMKRKGMVVPFSNAKFLHLVALEARQVLHVLEMFPNLMMLKVRLDQDLQLGFTGKIHAAMVKISLHSPSLLRLKTVEVTLFGWDTPIFPLFEILLENAHVLEKMVVRLGRGFRNPEPYTLVEEKVLGMPRSSPTALVIISKD